MRSSACVIVLAGIALAVGSRGGETQKPGGLTDIATPASEGSGQPYLWADGRGALLSWLEPADGVGHRFRFATKTGNGWSEPETIAQGPNLVVNWADVPSIVRLADGRLAAQWLELISREDFTYKVLVKTSADGGKTWSEAFTPHRDGAAAEHGFVSLFQASEGDLGIVWLDGRNYAGHDHESQSKAGGPSTMVRFATLSEDGKLGPDTLVDATVCDCCPTAAAPADGGIVLAYRDRSEDQIRDIYVTRLENGVWTEPYPVHPDGWKIDGCPVNGPALSTFGKAVVIAWMTGAGNEPKVMTAFSQDGGRSFGASARVDDGKPIGRVDVELIEGGAVVSWIERTGDGAEVRFRRISSDGQVQPSAVAAAVDAGRVSGIPRMVRDGNELVFAWTSTGETQRIKTARTPL